MKKRVVDILAETLLEANITDCFSVVGGGAMYLNNALGTCQKMNTIYNHHEQACAMAAEGYARLSGKLPLVCVTSGPGGTNVLNGVQGAWSDSIPMLVVSGHPRLATTIPQGLKLRARGVQEFNIIDTVKHMTKYAKFLTEAKDIKYEIQKAIHVAMTGRRGPVWIDIPLDIQNTEVDTENLHSYTPEDKRTNVSKQVKDLYEEIKKSKRPCLLTGSGLRSSNAVEDFKNSIKEWNIPIVGGSLQADILPSGFPNYYGMSGSVGPRAGNFILQNADLIITLGNSLSYKQTGFNIEGFAPNAKIIMVDIEADEGKKPGLNIHSTIVADLKDFFTELKKLNEKINTPSEWVSYCNGLLNQFSNTELLESLLPIQPSERVPNAYAWDFLRRKARNDEIFALGNSSCIVGLLQTGTLNEQQRVLVNYNTGSMGDDIPEAIGATIAAKKRVLCVTGDGSVMLNIQELQTIAHYKLPIKLVIFSNEGYNAIRQTCKNFFDSVYVGCDPQTGVSFPDFKKLTNAFNISFKRCHNNAEVEESIDWLLKDDNAAVLEIMQKLDDPIIPRLMSRVNEDGSFQTPALHDMAPFLDEKEVEKLMISLFGE